MSRQLARKIISQKPLLTELCKKCKTARFEELSRALVVVSLNEGLLDEVLDCIISLEIENARISQEILRSNSLCSRVLHWILQFTVPKSYLHSCLRVPLSSVVEQFIDFEIDESYLSHEAEDQVLLEHQATLYRVTKKLLLHIISSSNCYTPYLIRKICYLIRKNVITRFPNDYLTSLATFVFLRYFCPAIIYPEVTGIISLVSESSDVRRSLILIAKLLQITVNNLDINTTQSIPNPLLLQPSQNQDQIQNQIQKTMKIENSNFDINREYHNRFSIICKKEFSTNGSRFTLLHEISTDMVNHLTYYRSNSIVEEPEFDLDFGTGITQPQTVKPISENRKNSFSPKETYMIPMKPFVEEHSVVLKNFLLWISEQPESRDSKTDQQKFSFSEINKSRIIICDMAVENLHDSDIQIEEEPLMI